MYDFCYPFDVWSGTVRDTNYYTATAFIGGTFNASLSCDSTGRCQRLHAFSVRCLPFILLL